jgi:CBS domain-containing protein
MKTLGELTKTKPMVYASSGQSIMDVIKLMAEKNVGAVPILDSSGGLKGIFSERDVLKRCITQKIDLEKTLVDDVMTKGVIVMDSADSYEDCLKIMKQESIRHIPVREGDDLAGMVSIRDLMQIDVDAKEQEIEILNSYIRYNLSK